MPGFPTTPWGIMDLFYGLFIGSFEVLLYRARDYDCFAYMFAMGIRIGNYAGFYDEEFTGETGQWFGLIFKLFFDILGIYNTLNRCIGQYHWSNKVPWRSAFRDQIRLPYHEAEAAKRKAADIAKMKAAKAARARLDKANKLCADGDEKMCKVAEKMIAAAAEKEAEKEGEQEEKKEVAVENEDDPEPWGWEENSNAMLKENDKEPVVGHEAFGFTFIYVFLYCIQIVLASVFTYTNIDSNYYYYNIGIQISRLFSAILMLIDYITKVGILNPRKAWNEKGPMDLYWHEI